ncbi:hypothetical protein [Aeromonas veronii]|uniref:hypothetical protein n=1 Tax=Aeromonas veronii TaxID=654 RepID=UPI001302D154|nr:hypothetical protein [Aeromonas veronii]KAE9630749.1 hypothetical protein GO977_19025 [Aeromonas veronii]
MKSGNFCCNRRCQLVKSAARYRSALAQDDFLDSAVPLLGGDQFQQIQPMAAMVDRGANQLDICPFAHGKKGWQKDASEKCQ